jgi:CRISPR system Cascade subunit CasA
VRGTEYPIARVGRPLLMAYLLAGLGACVHYQSAPLAPETSVAKFASLRLDDQELRDRVSHFLPRVAAEWPPREWDRATLLAIALAQNPALAAVRAEIRTTLAHEITAAQLPNPGFTLESEYARNDAHPWLYGVGFDWLLRSPSRRRLEIELARLDTHDARLRIMEAVWSTRRALVAALSDAQGARARLALLDRLAAAEDQLVVIEERRIQAGEDPPSELVSSQRSRIEIEQQQSEQRAQAQASQAAIARALGVPFQALDGVMLSWADWGEPAPISDAALGNHREQALLTRADLRIAIGEYTAAETKLHLAVARQYPEVTLEPGYYWDHGIAKFPLDVGFELPLNGNRGEIAEARAARELAGQRMLALQADIYNEIFAAGRAEALARADISVAERQCRAARTQLQQIALGVRLGASDSLQQTAAEVIVMRAELELLEMRARLQTARNELEDVLHTPLSGPELEIGAAAT